MTKSERNIFVDLFREAQRREIKRVEALPGIPFARSDEYVSKMSEIATTQHDVESKVIKIGLRKRLIAIIAAILAVITTASACACVEEINKFFAEFVDTSFEIHAGEITKIEEEYAILGMPEGFENTFSDKSKESYYRQFVSEELGQITFIQNTVRTGLGMNIEDPGCFEITVNGHTVYCSHSYNGCAFAWVQDGYSFFLLWYGDNAWEIKNPEMEEVLIKMIESVGRVK